MKRLYHLLVILGVSLCCAKPASAQEYGGDYAQQTRYVYLWDVTASTLSKDGSQFNKISEFLVRDIKSKPAGSNIKVVPFNDCVLENAIESIDGSVVLDSLVSRGHRLAEVHKKDWERNSNATKGAGYTNIASAIDYVERNYINDSWNTIVILLTDGGQEYYNDEDHLAQRKSGVNGLADDYLLSSIKELKYKIEGARSFNRLYYVVTTSVESDDPRKIDREGFLANCSQIKCIVASQGSINLYLPELEVKSAVEAISSRDTSFELEVLGLANEVLSQLNLIVSAPAIGVYNLKCKVNQDNRIEISNCNFTQLMGENTDATFEVKLSLDKSDVEVGRDLYCVRLKRNTVSLKVTNNFRPVITVRLR